MRFLRTSRMRLIGWLELGLGLELYACAVLALHARGLRATPLDATPVLVLPALVIPPVFYLLVAIVSMRPFSLTRVLGATGAMCGIHAVLVAATGALFMIPDLVDYAGALAFALWGAPAVTLLQLTAAPLVFARLRPLLLAPRGAPRADASGTAPPRRVETPGVAAPRTPVAAPRDVAPPLAPRAPVVTPPLPPLVARESNALLPAFAAARPAVLTPPAAPPPLAMAARTVAPATAEAMVRVPFNRIAEQLPVDMFVRGREGLNATLRPGVSLLVPRRLLLPHLGEGLALVKWGVVADQFPHDELALTHDQIASRLPNGSLMLPLDEVVPQIPAELLVLSTPAVDVYGIEEFPPPFQPHVPPSSENAVADAGVPAELEAPALAEPEPVSASEQVEAPEPPPELEAPAEPESLAEPEAPAELELPVESESSMDQEPVAPEPAPGGLVDRGRTAEARRIATLLAPLMNGLEIGECDGAGMTLVTVVAPAVSEDSVVRTAVRVASFLTDARLPSPVTQATLTGAEATVVLTPFGSLDDGGTLLVTAMASRASLAWLERLSRTAAGEARAGSGNGKHAGTSGDPLRETELRITTVPPSVRELAGSLTAFGPVAPTVLRDTAGALSACLFLPSSLEALPLAEFARDLYGVLEEAEIGAVASVIVKMGAHRLVVRAVDGVSGRAMLVGGGPIDRPGLARIELDRAATRLGALVRG